MRFPFFKAPLLSLVAGVLIASFACSSLPLQRAARAPARTEPFTASEQIAGEIMAYLMEVVLGRAGDPRARAAWEDTYYWFELVGRRPARTRGVGPAYRQQSRHG